MQSGNGAQFLNTTFLSLLLGFTPGGGTDSISIDPSTSIYVSL